MKLLEDSGIVLVRDFGDGRARYEISSNEHHDHLIDIEDGKVIEFVDDQIEKLQHDVAKKLGYYLTGHRMELYGKKIKKNWVIKLVLEYFDGYSRRLF